MVPISSFVYCNVSASVPLIPTTDVLTSDAPGSYSVRTSRMLDFGIESLLAKSYVLQTRSSHRRVIFWLMRV